MTMDKSDAPKSGEIGRYFAGDQQTPKGWYLTASEAIVFLGVSRDLFYDTIIGTLTKYKLPTFPKRFFYQLAELEAIKRLRPPRPPAGDQD